LRVPESAVLGPVGADFHYAQVQLSTRASGARHESSMAKVTCSEAIWRVVDRSMQVLSGLGITDDTIVARPFRIYDGPRRCIAGRPSGASCGG